jgi:hypothetical protein
MILVNPEAGHNSCMILPVAPRPGQLAAQRWMMVLAGVVDLNVESNRGIWEQQEVNLYFNIFGVLLREHPRPGSNRDLVFQPEWQVCLATIDRLEDHGMPTKFGAEVCYKNLYLVERPDDAGRMVQSFQGINVDIGYQNASLKRMGYHVTLVGTILEVPALPQPS